MMAMNKNLVAPFALVAALAVGCGEDPAGNGGTTGGDGGANTGTTSGGNNGGAGELDLCLVPVLNSACNMPAAPINTPHEVLLLNSETNEPVPGFESQMTGANGQLVLNNPPTDYDTNIYMIGSGTTDEDTYDSVALHQRFGSGDPLLRISTVGLSGTASLTGEFENKLDRAPVTGTVYWTPGGAGTERQDQIGCAQVFVDETGVPVGGEYDLRYNGDNGLPVAPQMQQQTNDSGRFYIANLTSGPHTIKVSMDQGQSFIFEKDIVIHEVRNTSRGPTDLILYLLGLDVPMTDEMPTKPGCE